MSSVAVGDLFGPIIGRAARGTERQRVWGGSKLVADVPPKPVVYSAAAKLLHKFEAVLDVLFQRKVPGTHGGEITHLAEKVYRVLALYCRDRNTDEISPSHSYIARKARSCTSAVARAIAYLKRLGFIAWERRCVRDRDGRLTQETNLYELRPPEKWLHKPRPNAPAPHPTTIGVPEPVLAPLDAAGDAIDRGDREEAIAHFETATHANLSRDARALARAQASALRTAAQAAADPVRRAAMEAMDAERAERVARETAEWLMGRRPTKT